MKIDILKVCKGEDILSEIHFIPYELEDMEQEAEADKMYRIKLVIEEIDTDE